MTLEAQVAKTAILIMQNSLNDRYTPKTEIIDKCISEEYKAKNASIVGRVEGYVDRCVSKARAAFRQVCGSEVNNFPVKRGTGYIFKG